MPKWFTKLRYWHTRADRWFDQYWPEIFMISVMVSIFCFLLLAGTLAAIWTAFH